MVTLYMNSGIALSLSFSTYMGSQRWAIFFLEVEMTGILQVFKSFRKTQTSCNLEQSLRILTQTEKLSNAVVIS